MDNSQQALNNWVGLYFKKKIHGIRPHYGPAWHVQG